MKYNTSECNDATNVLNLPIQVSQTMTSGGIQTTSSSASTPMSGCIGNAGAAGGANNHGHAHGVLGGSGGGYSAAAAGGGGGTPALVSSQPKVSPSTTQLFCEQVGCVTSLFEKWNDCERTVVMYALLKKMRYSSLKFLQHSIENTLSQNVGTSHTNLSTVVIDINANNPSYLQNLLNAYNTFQLGDLADSLSSSSSDKDSLTQCYSSDLQLTQCDERRLYGKKEDILHEILNMLPLLKPGNDDAKQIYLTLIPNAVKDTARRIVPAELVQQIFSYLLIHPAITSEDRRSLNVWLRHLEDYINMANGFNNNNNYNNNSSSGSNSSSYGSGLHQQHKQQSGMANCFLLPAYPVMGGLDHKPMTTSGSSASSSSSVSCSSVSNISIASSFGNLASLGIGSGSTGSIAGGGGLGNSSSIGGTRSADWQTIAPPSKQHQQQQHINQQQHKLLHDWSNLVGPNQSTTKTASSLGGSGSSIADQLCDNLNGITLNELASSQNNLGLTSIAVGSPVGADISSSLVNGVVAAAAAAAAATVGSTSTSLFGGSGATNPIINKFNNNTINNNNNSCSSNLNGDDHDTSFSKNGTEILDFEPNSCDSCSNSKNNTNNSTNINNNIHNNTNAINNSMLTQMQQQMHYASIMVSNYDPLDINRWSLDSKLAALKTRRSNSLTTQTISSSSSSSNSSVVTVNDNCSNSTENLALFANKPRSFSLSIEHQRGGMANSGSDTRLDDFKPNYVKFQTRNLGMSSIGWWLKSLRLHKYIELFKNMTYEEMLQITEEYLQNLGVTKGASHKLALCIEKLKERPMHLAKMEQDLLSGQINVTTAIEELTHIVLTPMKPIEAVNSGEENVGLRFLNVIDLVCKIASNDLYSSQDDESLSVIMWVLDRSLQSEAFGNHINELKELKFKLSKLKMSITPKMHHAKNLSNGNLNKPRWNGGKGRKCDPKNASNDRINHRKNSNDLLSFPLSCLQQQQQQPQQHHTHQHSGRPNQQQTDYERYHHININNNSNSNTNNNINNNNNNNNCNNNNINNNSGHHQYKGSLYQNFINNNNSNNHLKQQQQQQIQQQLLQQHAHFPALPQQQPQQQQQRSLNNLIVVSGGPQQPQNMIYKQGQGMVPASVGAEITTHMENSLKQQPQQRQNTLIEKRVDATEVGQQQQQQQPKKTMAAVVMENLAKFDQHFTLF